MLRSRKESLLACRFMNGLSVIDENDKAFWKAYKSVLDNFLGNQRADHYNVAVSKLLTTFGELGCNISFKTLYCLTSQLLPKQL